MKSDLIKVLALSIVFALPAASFAQTRTDGEVAAVKEMPAVPVIWADDDKDDEKKDKKK
jgi:hypothetical protein